MMDRNVHREGTGPKVGLSPGMELFSTVPGPFIGESPSSECPREEVLFMMHGYFVMHGFSYVSDCLCVQLLLIDPFS